MVRYFVTTGVAVGTSVAAAIGMTTVAAVEKMPHLREKMVTVVGVKAVAVETM